MTNEVTEDEAALIRAVESEGFHGEWVYAARIWAPIEREEATGRARCRLCGDLISKGVECIAFMFDPYGGKDQWGRLAKAYLHIECKEDK